MEVAGSVELELLLKRLGPRLRESLCGSTRGSPWGTFWAFVVEPVPLRAVASPPVELRGTMEGSYLAAA